MMTEKKPSCSFCGKNKNQVKKLISGGDVFICNECIDTCNEVLRNESKSDISASIEIPNPSKIKKFLDEYVIGQEDAKIVMSVILNTHYKRVTNTDFKNDVEIEKSCVLMLGSSGSGKTYLVKTLARLLDIPLVIVDATTLTETGYIGEDVESLVCKLLSAANGDVSKAERGIIFVDEIDKKAKKYTNSSNMRDVSGEGVQQSLLKMIEGTEVKVTTTSSRKSIHPEMVTIDTKNILFIFGGAFTGISEIISKRLNTQESSMGFNSKIQENDKTIDLLKNVTTEDVISYGLIPEFVGRLPIITHLNELTENQLVSILTEPKNAIIKQYKKLFELEKISLEFTNDALLTIAKKAIINKTGARGLRTIIENKLMKIQYDLPELYESGVREIIISGDYINNLTDYIKMFDINEGELTSQ